MILKNINKLASVLDSELSHNLAILFLRLGIYPKTQVYKIQSNIGNLKFRNPLGLAAGFDKNGMVINQISNLGFGFTEIGTVTPNPQSGNRKPRIFRLAEDKAIINRNGFNNDGMNIIKQRLKTYKNKRNNNSFFVGVNIGPNYNSKNRANDYKILTQELASFCDYITINVSSPNTLGLRNLQSKKNLELVIKSVFEGIVFNGININTFPVFVKISPDLNEKELEKLIYTCMNHQVSGLIISNTTIDRNLELKSTFQNQNGGLSGKPLFKKSTKLLIKANQICKRLNKNPIFIAAGGIENSESAYVKILSGAHLFQIYTSLAFKGPLVINQILLGIVNLMHRDKIDNLDNIRGIANSYEEAKKMAKNGLK